MASTFLSFSPPRARVARLYLLLLLLLVLLLFLSLLILLLILPLTTVDLGTNFVFEVSAITFFGNIAVVLMNSPGFRAVPLFLMALEEVLVLLRAVLALPLLEVGRDLRTATFADVV